MFSKLKLIPLSSIFIALAGIVLGLLVGFLLSIPIDKLPYDWSWAVSVGAYLVSVIVMVVLFILGKERIIDSAEKLWPKRTTLEEAKGSVEEDDKKSPSRVSAKKIDWERAYVLDTSAIIDGRIADVVSTGFMEGVLVVPSFVLDELQKISDSSSRIKRNRGRRGLEILRSLRREKSLPFVVYEKAVADSQEVDKALVDLAAGKGAKIITTDFNLNRVGKVKGVRVLNINELANMVKTVLVPGEELEVEVIQEGKEEGQGVAYLPDGTMIVVEGGAAHIGDRVGVVVERLFQTEAGRMIFVKPI